MQSQNQLKYLIPCLLFLANALVVNGQQLIKDDDYKIEVPASWIPLSKGFIQDLIDKNRNSFESSGFEYPRSHVIGYCMNDTLGEEPPFLIRVFNEMQNYTAVKFDSIIEVNCSAWRKIGLYANPIVDRENFRFYLTAELNEKFIFMAYMPGESGLLQLSYHSKIDSAEAPNIPIS